MNWVATVETGHERWVNMEYILTGHGRWVNIVGMVKLDVDGG